MIFYLFFIFMEPSLSQMIKIPYIVHGNGAALLLSLGSIMAQWFFIFMEPSLVLLMAQWCVTVWTKTLRKILPRYLYQNSATAEWFFFLGQTDLSMTSYFTKMKILRDELCNFSPIPSCDSSSTGCCKSSKTV